MTYVFVKKNNIHDRIAVAAYSYDQAHEALWQCIVGVSGLFTSQFKLFAIHKDVFYKDFKFSHRYESPQQTN